MQAASTILSILLSARCVLSRTLRTPRRAANKWDLRTVCNLVFLKTKSTVAAPAAACAAAATSSARTCSGSRCCESERSLAGLAQLLWMWMWMCVRSELSWQPDNDLDDEPKRAGPRRAAPSRTRGRGRGWRASQTKCINSPLYCLPAFCYSLRFTIYHLPLPFAIALCGFIPLPAIRTPLSRLLDKFTRRPIDSFQLSPGSNSISQDLPSSPARLCCRLNYRQQLQLLLVLPTLCRSHSFHTIHSPADVAFVLRFVHKLVTSESTTTKDGG